MRTDTPYLLLAVATGAAGLMVLLQAIRMVATDGRAGVWGPYIAAMIAGVVALVVLR